MNLVEIDDKYILFVSEVECFKKDEINSDEISSFIKDIFIVLDEVYGIESSGFYKIDIYVDLLIGSYVEIEKIDEYISQYKKVDTKVTIDKTNFYLKSKDLEIFYDIKPIYKLDEYYYVKTDRVKDIDKIIEFCEIEYKNDKIKSCI